MLRVAILLALLVAPLAGCLGAPSDAPAPASSSPVAAADPLPLTRFEYEAGTVLLSDSRRGNLYPAPVRGSVHLPDGPGPFPVVVFLHGRSASCTVDGLSVGFVPCATRAPLVEPIESHAGYDYLAEALAPRGYVVVSIDARTINERDELVILPVPAPAPRLPEVAEATAGARRVLRGDSGMFARGEIVLHTLDRLAEANATGEGPLAAVAGRLDLSRVGLMGHSRGGEGIVWALELARERGLPYGIRALFAIGPSEFFGHDAVDVAYAALLPSCDGDNWTLGGANVFDRIRYIEENARGRGLQILEIGANHNFYNRNWLGDDASWMRGEDELCGAEPGNAGRLTREQQEAHLAYLLPAFFRLHLGNERAFAAPLAGAEPLPPEACPDARAGCGAVLHLSDHPPEAARRVLLPGDAVPAGAAGFAHAGVCAARECEGTFRVGAAERLALAWSGKATLRLPLDPGDSAGFDALQLRVAVVHGASENAGLAAQDFTIRLVDTNGATASLPASAFGEALFYPRGEDRYGARVVLNALRAPLAAFEGIDAERLASIEFVFDRTPAGRVEVADVMLVASA